MTAFPANHATTLKAAYRICTPEPLDGEGLNLYYVDLAEVRRSEAIARVSTILDFQDAGEHNTILFTGHRGCGKSTELKHLQRQWEKTFHVIYLEAYKIAMRRSPPSNHRTNLHALTSALFCQFSTKVHSQSFTKLHSKR